MAMLKKKNFLIWGIFLLGFLICSYPIGSSIYESMNQNQLISTYDNEVKDIDKDSLENSLLEAEKYNSMLFQTQGAYVGNLNENILSDENYHELLNFSGNGVMATIEIPKINVDLPIFHGTDDEVLSTGVGHLQSSSLPVGGTSTHCILTGHRGLPSSKLFTRLDEIIDGDLFFINVCNETLAYQVFDIQVIEPEDLELLRIEADQDLVSLVTCTPYGINTHRLVITGKRVPYEQSVKENIQPNMISLRELMFSILPFTILVFVIVREVLKKRKEKFANENKKN